jgi:hypothetical protein
MNVVPEKCEIFGGKVRNITSKTLFLLNSLYFVIFLKYGSCPVKPLLSSNSVYRDVIANAAVSGSNPAPLTVS